ncbi:cystathionine beta-synthase-like [Toxorhynchites rutilus septentrionalis]|uniref:cystathionine beta-synthase-like n=1 Tax=Toxorhynchites rutilus septentrionalis TaxID=329112 RepID=UPI0024787A88|nr:cystathionine beta-synthase-like [Toxorhynchites rutilus septentrionalis]
MSSTADLRTCPMNGHQTNGTASVATGNGAISRDEFLATFKRPDLPSRCTWAANTDEPSPHHHKPLTPRPKVMQTILEAVGNTPLVKLDKIAKAANLKCNLYGKCEFLSPGGSVKDRIGLRMIEEAERKGLLKPGCSIIEPTSGNTGIGLAMGAAVKGYKCVIVMPEKMSNEKVDTLKALGATVIRTPTEAAFDSPEGLIAVAQKLQQEIPDSIVLNQYTNAGNPLAHYDGTGAEIFDQLNGMVDMVVVGAGTGGTVAGIGRKLKELKSDCIIVGADPEGSILAEPEELNKSDVSFYEVEGVGYDFIPTVLDRSVVDRWIKFNDKAALPMARRLIAEEGLLCGGSSGGNVAAALLAAKDLEVGQNCVIILPDNIRNYLSKFVSDNWMEARDFKESVNVHNHKWWNNKISQLSLRTPITVGTDVCLQKVMNIMKNNSVNQLPVIDNNEAIVGVVSMPNLMGKLLNRLAKPTDPVSRAIFKQFVKIDQNDHVGHASRILEKDPFVLVVHKEKKYTDEENFQLKEKVIGILTQKDMLEYISNAENLTNGV